MKRLLLALLLVSSVSLPLAWGQTESSQQEAALNAQDTKELKEQVQALTELLKSNAPDESEAKTTANSPQTRSSKRTVADVLDKALDLTSSSIAFIAAKVENAAPHVWRIMIFQQYAKAIGDAVLPWGLLLITIVFYRLMAKKWPATETKDGTDENSARIWLTRIIPIALGFVFGIWGMISLSDSIKYIINPEYYAIKDLFGIVMGNVKM